MSDLPANKDLIRYVKTIREMRDRGWTVDIIVRLALGEASPEDRSDDEIAIVTELYRRDLERAGLLTAGGDAGQ